MKLTLIAAAPVAVQIHLATVIPAFVIGTWLIFASRKGARLHRLFGALYLVLMTVTAITTLFIRQVNPGSLSWIHLFIPLTIAGVGGSIFALWRRDIKGHRNAMISLYFGALIIAGGFTLLPGRLLYAVFFGAE